MEKDIIIKGQKLHYEETGPETGVPVVLMHGWGCDHSTVKSIASILDPTMHVYNLDLPGHGLSQEPPSPWGVEDFTSFVEDFIKANNIVSPVVIGHSFGGRVGILLASRGDVRKMILVDSAGIKPVRPLSYYIKVYFYKTLKHLLPFLFGKKRGEDLLRRYRGKAGSSDYRNSSEMMRRVMSRCVNEDLRHVMPSISAPTLLVWGNDDTATPVSDARQMERLIPDAGLVAFDACGHYSFLDNPLGFRAVVRSFLKNEIDNSQI